MKTLRPFQPGRRAFSLVEVAIALGIAVFCLLTVVALLPAGLDAVRSSRDEDGAARCLEQIALALRSATTTADGQYRASGNYAKLIWTPAKGLGLTQEDLSIDGVPAADALDQRLVARVEIAPSSGTPTSQALVSVAWPKHAKWDAASAMWRGAQGSVFMWVVFRSP